MALGGTGKVGPGIVVTVLNSVASGEIVGVKITLWTAMVGEADGVGTPPGTVRPQAIRISGNEYRAMRLSFSTLLNIERIIQQGLI